MNRIRELRKQKKMTQKELAKHLRIADSTLSYWEMGKYEPDNESLRQLSSFFHVPIDYILGGDFTEWESARTKTSYADFDSLLPASADVSVNEKKTIYKSNVVDSSLNHGYTQDTSGSHSKEQDASNDRSNEQDASDSRSLEQGAIHSLGGDLDAFRRSEFEGLTQDEIERLAEYAEFLKLQRSKRR